MRLLIAPMLTAALLLLPACSPAATLEQVLAAMDKTAASFRDMSAEMTKVVHTAVINDDSEESGTVRMQRTGSRAVRMVIEFSGPDTRTVTFEKNTAQVYHPKMKAVQVWELGKYRALVDQFLLLGFGSSGQELKQTYSLRVTGEEQVGGEQATRLELVPISPSVLEHLKKAELWISPAGYPLQQKFHTASGDYTLVTYAGVKLNTNLPEDTFRLKLPSGVKREYPQR
jgi:outer membrane lipoprotein-sorting protein